MASLFKKARRTDQMVASSTHCNFLKKRHVCEKKRTNRYSKRIEAFFWKNN